MVQKIAFSFRIPSAFLPHYFINCVGKIGPRIENEIHSFEMSVPSTRCHQYDQCRARVVLSKRLLTILQLAE
jgi:hypothetical protein